MTERSKDVRKRERQEELRDFIDAKKQLTKVIENIEEIESSGVEIIEGEEIDYKAYQVADFNVKRLKSAAELRLKLLTKALPDLKSIENSFDMDENKGKMTFTWEQ